MKALLLAAALAGMGAGAWDPAPWIADLAAMKAAIAEKYANLEWLEEERGVVPATLYPAVEAQLAAAGDDAAARRVLDRFTARFRDGHVALRWPGRGGAVPVVKKPPTPAGFCAALGYDAGKVTAGRAKDLPGYRALPRIGVIPAGMVGEVGVVRIGMFGPDGYPTLCTDAVAAERIAIDRACDDACADRVITHAFAKLTTDLAAALRQVRGAGARVVMVDLSGNGGGSEWAEAAARMLSRRPLVSAPLGFVRGAHWTRYWADTAATLRGYRAKAGARERGELDGWIARAEAARREAAAPCVAGTGCTRLARAGTAAGLAGNVPAGAFAGRDWGVHVFNPAQFPYRDGVWDGPVVVLVDGQTWSAAEQFAAVLRDNDAAVVLGERTGGAGCGHTRGGTPTVLPHSRAVLTLPDCARFRRDGSNEVRGIVPDVPTGARADDGAGVIAALTAARLPEAVVRARALYAMRSGTAAASSARLAGGAMASQGKTYQSLVTVRSMVRAR